MQFTIFIEAAVGGVSGYTKGFGIFESGPGVITDTVSTSQSQSLNGTSYFDFSKSALKCAVKGIAKGVIGGYLSTAAFGLSTPAAPIIGTVIAIGTIAYAGSALISCL